MTLRSGSTEAETSTTDSAIATMRESYELTNSFVLRMSGFSVGWLDKLLSTDVSLHTDRFSEAKRIVNDAIDMALSGRTHIERNLRKRLKKFRHATTREWEDYAIFPFELKELGDSLKREGELHEALRHAYEGALQQNREALYEFARNDRFREVLLLSSPDLLKLTPADSLLPHGPRNSHIRQRELTWSLYLQRLTTKNETISFFGPSTWGRFDRDAKQVATVALNRPNIDATTVYFERWVCESLANLISASADVRPYLTCRLADDLLLDNNGATLLRSGSVVEITAEERDLIGRISQSSQANASAVADRLVERGIVIRGIQIAPSPNPFVCLIENVKDLPASAGRDHWLPALHELDAHRLAIEKAGGFADRAAAIDGLRATLLKIGVQDCRTSQDLYASRLPINEDCHLSTSALVLGAGVTERLERDAAPWYSLWRDCAGLYATRLRQALLLEHGGAIGSRIPFLELWPSIVRASGSLKAVEEELQTAWHDQLGDRAFLPEVQLDDDDTNFIRRRFELTRMKAFDNLAPDFQLIPHDVGGFADGNWNLLIAEIHPDFTVWQHCFFRWHGDPREYALDYARRGGQGHAAVVGAYPPYFSSAHTSLWVYPYAHHWSFVGVPAPDGALAVRSAEVFIEITVDDVCLFHADGTRLGSVLHTWNTSINTHRLELRGRFNHSPRLKVGRVIVQRESWILEPWNELKNEVRKGGISAFIALQELKGSLTLPDVLFVKGFPKQRMAFEKDIKPIFVDFRSPLLLESFGKLISRFDKIILTEALPSPHQSWIGCGTELYSNEFRTVVLASDRVSAI